MIYYSYLFYIITIGRRLGCFYGQEKKEVKNKQKTLARKNSASTSASNNNYVTTFMFQISTRSCPLIFLISDYFLNIYSSFLLSLIDVSLYYVKYKAAAVCVIIFCTKISRPQ